MKENRWVWNSGNRKDGRENSPPKKAHKYHFVLEANRNDCPKTSCQIFSHSIVSEPDPVVPRLVTVKVSIQCNVDFHTGPGVVLVPHS